MASAKKKAVKKAKKPASPARKPSAPKKAKPPARPAAKRPAKPAKPAKAGKTAKPAKPAKATAAAKAPPKGNSDKERLAAERAALKQAQQEKREVQRQLDAERKLREKAEKEAERLKEQAQKDLAKALEKAEKEAQKAVEKLQKDAAKERERAEKEAQKAAERAEKEAQKAAERAAKDAEKEAKKKPFVRTGLAATPVFRPLPGAETAAPAPPPPPAKPGHVDHQVLSAISYGIFAAVNKAFGFAGQSVVKNAALRMLEYGYKRGWLPPKAKDPIRALNEFFGRLETMGYAEKIHVGKRGEGHVLEVQGLADFDAVHSLRELHYPLLPVFLGEMLTAIVDQYFGQVVTTEPLQMQEDKRGFTLPFSLHERPQVAEVSRLATYARVDEFEE